MKPLFTLLFILYASITFAQITFEHTYTETASLVQISPTEWNYYTSDSNSINIYDITHSLIKTITTPQVSGFKFGGVSYLSQTLFNTDQNYEFIASYNHVVSSPFVFEIYENVYDENGTLLFSSGTLDSIADIGIQNSGNGIKMLCSYYSAHSESNFPTNVYSLGGNFYPTYAARPMGNDNGVSNSYPNPTADVIHLPYTIDNGQPGELLITNLNGQLMKQYKVTSAFNDVLLDTKELPKGSYLYYLVVDGTQGAAKQFIVQ